MPGHDAGREVGLAGEGVGRAAGDAGEGEGGGVVQHSWHFNRLFSFLPLTCANREEEAESVFRQLVKRPPCVTVERKPNLPAH